MHISSCETRKAVCKSAIASFASRCACGCSAGICGRSVSSRRDSAAASSGPEMSCAGVILRPLAISSMESDRRQFSPFR